MSDRISFKQPKNALVQGTLFTHLGIANIVMEAFEAFAIDYLNLAENVDVLIIGSHGRSTLPTWISLITLW